VFSYASNIYKYHFFSLKKCNLSNCIVFASYDFLRSKAALLSARLSHRNFVRLSVCLSLRLSVRPLHGWNEIGPRLNLRDTLLSFVIQIDNLVFVY